MIVSFPQVIYTVTEGKDGFAELTIAKSRRIDNNISVAVKSSSGAGLAHGMFEKARPTTYIDIELSTYSMSVIEHNICWHSF